MIALSDGSTIKICPPPLVGLSSKQPHGGFSLVTYKTKVPHEHWSKLDVLAALSVGVVKQMLADRSKTSSKFYKEVPCVVAKSLSRKYQRNAKCKSVSRLCIPICGDKGKQVKIVEGGLRVPALFKKAVIPCQFPMPVSGFIRQVEFFRRDGQWFMSYSYNTPCTAAIKPMGCIGVDRNSLGNIAVLALRGIPVIEVDAAYSSQECSRCGQRHKVNGKQFRCPHCNSNNHRDANAAFVIGQRGNKVLDGGDSVENVAPLRPIDGSPTGKVGQNYVQE